MAKDFKPSVSVEEMAAYLDSNLPEEEMQSVHSLIEGDENLGNLFDEVSVVNNDLEEISLGQNPLELDLPDSWLLPDPQYSSIEIDFSVMDDLFNNDTLVDQDDIASIDQSCDEY